MRSFVVGVASYVLLLTSSAHADVIVTGSVTGANGAALPGATIKVSANDGNDASAEDFVTDSNFQLKLGPNVTSVVCYAEASGYKSSRVVRLVDDKSKADCGKIKLLPWVTAGNSNVTAAVVTQTMQVEVILQTSEEAPQTKFKDIEMALPLPPMGDSKCSGADRELRSTISSILRTSSTDATVSATLDVGVPGASDMTANGRVRVSACEAGELLVQIPLSFAVPAHGGTLKYTLAFPTNIADFGMRVPEAKKNLDVRPCNTASCLVGHLRFRGDGRVVAAIADFPIAVSFKEVP